MSLDAVLRTGGRLEMRNGRALVWKDAAFKDALFFVRGNSLRGSHQRTGCTGLPQTIQ